MKIFLLRFIIFTYYVRSSYSGSRRSSGPLLKTLGIDKGINYIVYQYLKECRDTKLEDENNEHLAVVSKYTKNFAARKTNNDVRGAKLIINKQKSEFSKYKDVYGLKNRLAAFYSFISTLYYVDPKIFSSMDYFFGASKDITCSHDVIVKLRSFGATYAEKTYEHDLGRVDELKDEMKTVFYVIFN